MEMFPLLLLTLLLVAMIMYSRRNKQRMATADRLRRERITAGTDVMTTSGLYGTVVSVNPDDTVLLSIAPGVEVRWTIAALREASELPEHYREPIAGGGGGQVSLTKDSADSDRSPRPDGTSPS